MNGMTQTRPLSKDDFQLPNLLPIINDCLHQASELAVAVNIIKESTMHKEPNEPTPSVRKGVRMKDITEAPAHVHGLQLSATVVFDAGNQGERVRLSFFLLKQPSVSFIASRWRISGSVA
eukprot:724207-Pelagomonas_calceolata.AAC.1